MHTQNIKYRFLLQILNLRLPRESDRLKGYGYVDFEDRESLINAMNMPDLVSANSFTCSNKQVYSKLFDGLM